MYDSKKIVEISLENLEKISGGSVDIIKDAINLAKHSVGYVDTAYQNIKEGNNGFFNGIFKTYGYEYVKPQEQNNNQNNWKFSGKNLLNFSDIFDSSVSSTQRAGSATSFGIVVVSGSLVLKFFKKIINTIC